MTLHPAEIVYRAGVRIDGRYRLQRCIGEGGMSWVWLAQHETLDVPVAIKLIKPQSRDAGRAWLAEARLLAMLDHEAIVRVLDSSCTEHGDPFLVMEHLSGHSLADTLCRDGRLPAPAAIRMLLPILDAVAHCHQRGIVHRDIKPENIFLSRDRDRTQPKLLDFGVAEHASAPCAGLQLSGTPGYMAPEQVQASDRIDGRADVWALCAVLYEMIAGAPAIQGNDWRERLTATTQSHVTPLWEHVASTRTLWPILARGLRQAPADRHATIVALQVALQSWLEAEAHPMPDGRPVRITLGEAPRRRRQLQWLVQ